MGNVQSSNDVYRRPPPRRSESDIFCGTNRCPERNRSRHCFVRRSERPLTRDVVVDAATRCCSPPPTIRPMQAASEHPLFCTENCRSSSQVRRGPPQQLSECDIFHGTHRNPEQNRNRHCFLERSQRPANGVGCVDADTRCCCPPPVTPSAPRPCRRCYCPVPKEEICPVTPTAPRPGRRCYCRMPKEEICPPVPVRQKVCCSSASMPQRCFKNCAGRAAPTGKVCHPDAYPVPEFPRTKPMCLHPLGARCNWNDQEEEAAVAIKPDTPLIPAPSCSVESLQPAVEAIKENCEEPQDQYFPYPPQNTRLQGFDPLANFDLNRFDREATHRGGGGRRRNVSIRTCVDYDYEPDYSPRERPYHPQGPSENPPARSHAPRSRPPPPPSNPQRHPVPRGPPGSYETPEYEIVKCPVSPRERPYHPQGPSEYQPARSHAPRSRPPPPPSNPQRHPVPRGPPGSNETPEYEIVKCPYK